MCAVQEAEAQRGQETCPGSHSCCKGVFPGSVPPPSTLTLRALFLCQKNTRKQAANIPLTVGGGNESKWVRFSFVGALPPPLRGGAQRTLTCG